MIKLIATDLDGTLLDENGELPEEIFGIIEKLNEKGILFSPASGRQYANLKRLFAPVKDKVLFICENGALVKYKEETLFSSGIDPALIPAAVNAVRKTSWGHIMLCCDDNAYIDDLYKPFSAAAHKAYANCREVDRLERFIGTENACKLAVFDGEAIAEKRIPFFDENIPGLKTVVSGKKWCDVMSPSTNKGVAIRVVEEKLGIKKEEIIGFGDHMNDYEMLLECGSAYITENGYEPLKKEIGNVIPSNAEKGVIKFLENLVG